MQPNPASYRDPDGFVFEHEGEIYRFIADAYEPHYQLLMQSGLYAQLSAVGKLIPHEEVTVSRPGGRVIKPQRIPFISYPYEWSFDMWKDAALLTLDMALTAFSKGMVLKDATPFNVQFIHSQPVFIDTLSLTAYEAGKPWVAYRQFAECFLGPLLLQRYGHPLANRVFAAYPNGIPLSLLVKWLPARARWSAGVNLHVFLQEKLTRNAHLARPAKAGSFSAKQFETLLRGLQAFVQNMKAPAIKTSWADYYATGILGPAYLAAKEALVKDFASEVGAQTIIDLGANDGHFCRLFKDKNIIALDVDGNCINQLYLMAKNEKWPILPLNADLLAPSPAIGWNNEERDSITHRLRADMVLALALVHHLAIGGNVPFDKIAAWLQPMAPNLLIEFVPKEDEKVQLLLQHRNDIFSHYSIGDFKAAFAPFFEISREELIGDTKRILFLMKRK